MFITGYHGTTIDSAKKIIKDNKFNISNQNDEWLGDGIYFYEKYSDAINWESKDKHQSNAVLHVIVEINDDEYIDFDSDEGKELFEGVMKIIKSEETIGVDNDSSQKNQCSTVNYIWQKNPNIKVIFASFPAKKSIYKVMLPYRALRREFCVRSNDVIKDITLLGGNKNV